jgi:hypothetical protein
MSDQLFAQDHRDFHKDEVDKSGAGLESFSWTRLNLDHQHYQIDIRCRDGQFGEQLWFAPNGVGGSLVAIRLSQVFPYTSTFQETILFECADPGFPNAVTGFEGEPSSCVLFATHLGEPQLTFRLPANTDNARMLVAALIYAFLICLTLYLLFALWWMGVLLVDDLSSSVASSPDNADPS